MKKCNRCKQEKATTEFYKNRGQKDGLCGCCKTCSKQHSLANYHKNPIQSMVKSLGRQRKYRYGVTPDDYEAMSRAQNGVCAICKKTENRYTEKHNRLRGLSVDHNHQTGEIRGLLCNKCNKGLGDFCDDLRLLRAAIKYLAQGGAHEEARVPVGLPFNPVGC